MCNQGYLKGVSRGSMEILGSIIRESLKGFIGVLCGDIGFRVYGLGFRNNMGLDFCCQKFGCPCFPESPA